MEQNNQQHHQIPSLLLRPTKPVIYHTQPRFKLIPSSTSTSTNRDLNKTIIAPPSDSISIRQPQPQQQSQKSVIPGGSKLPSPASKGVSRLKSPSPTSYMQLSTVTSTAVKPKPATSRLGIASSSTRTLARPSTAIPGTGIGRTILGPPKASGSSNQQQPAISNTGVSGIASKISTVTTKRSNQAISGSSRVATLPSLSRPNSYKQHVVSEASTTTTNSNSTSHQQRFNAKSQPPPPSTTTAVTKPKALIHASIDANHNHQISTNNALAITPKVQTTTAATNAIQPSNTLLKIHNSEPSSCLPIAQAIDISSINNDVGQIKNLLEQLLSLLKSSDESQEDLLEENQRLRREVSELKQKILKLTERPAIMDNRESVYFSPMI